jgi:molecular chaperone DnaK
MVKEAELHASEDAKRREEAELKNQADQLAYTTEKQLNELGSKITAEERAKIEPLIKDLRDAVNASDIVRIKSVMEQLQKAWYPISERLYREQAGTQTGYTTGTPPYGSQEKTTGEGKSTKEADYEVIK